MLYFLGKGLTGLFPHLSHTRLWVVSTDGYRLNTGSAEIRVTLTTSKTTCAKSEEGMVPASCIFQRVYTRLSPLKQLD